MKNVQFKAVMRISAIALALGVFSLNAYADIDTDANGLSLKEGVSLSELKTISPSLQAVRSGNQLSFVGTIPKRCAYDEAGKPNSDINYSVDGGQHILEFRLPSCESGFKKVPGEAMVPVSSVFHSINLQDVSGTLAVRFQQGGVDPQSPAVLSTEAYPSSDNAMKVVSSADQAAIDHDKKIDSLAADISSKCKSGNFVGVGDAIQGAADLLGDVSDIMDKVQSAEQDQFKAKLAAAKTAEEAKAAHDSYMAAADSNGWDTSALDQAYMDQRFALLSGMIEDLKADSDLKPASVDKAITSWQRELRSTDRASYRKNIDKFSSIYGDLAVNEAGKKDFKGAATYFEKAKALASTDSMKTKFDAQLAKVYGTEYKACLAEFKKSGGNPQACVTNYAAKSKEYADNVKDSLSNNASSSDDANAEYQAFLGAYNVTFAANGSLAQAEYSAINDYQTQVNQAYMQQMMGGGQQSMGGGQAASPLF